MIGWVPESASIVLDLFGHVATIRKASDRVRWTVSLDGETVAEGISESIERAQFESEHWIFSHHERRSAQMTQTEENS